MTQGLPKAKMEQGEVFICGKGWHRNARCATKYVTEVVSYGCSIVDGKLALLTILYRTTSGLGPTNTLNELIIPNPSTQHSASSHLRL